MDALIHLTNISWTRARNQAGIVIKLRNMSMEKRHRGVDSIIVTIELGDL